MMRQLLICGLVACAGASAHEPPPSPPAPPDVSAESRPTDSPPDGLPFEVAIEVKRRAGGTITPDAVLTTDEDFQIKLRTTHSAYVWVYGVNAANQPYRPDPDADPLLAPGENRIPRAANRWLYLQPPGGSETLVVIVSRWAVADVDRELAHVIGELEPARAPGAAAADQPGPPARTAPRKRRELGRRAPARDAGWVPDPTRLAALKPRGELRARQIGVRDDPGPTVLRAHDGLVVYVLRFSHKART